MTALAIIITVVGGVLGLLLLAHLVVRVMVLTEELRWSKFDADSTEKRLALLKATYEADPWKDKYELLQANLLTALKMAREEGERKGTGPLYKLNLQRQYNLGKSVGLVQGRIEGHIDGKREAEHEASLTRKEQS